MKITIEVEPLECGDPQPDLSRFLMDLNDFLGDCTWPFRIGRAVTS